MSETFETPVRLIILDPGHFHAALMQKERIPGVDETVEVFAPDGADVYGYFSLIENYNTREKNPTAWKMQSYIGDDYLQQMVQRKTGNLVILAGSNQKKSEYIKTSVNAGLDVLSDKPMAIDKAGYDDLKKSFETAEKNGNLIYDVMTSRYEWYNVIISRLLKDNFPGKIEKGTSENPAITLHSTHYFYKSVSGITLVRPPWYFDIAQQGPGIVDITSHLADLVQWFNQPQQNITPKDIHVFEAKQWPTLLPKEAYFEITRQNEIPSYLKPVLHDDSLSVFANGSFTYKLKDIIAKIGVEWKYKPQDNETDAYTATIRCSHCVIRVFQDREHHFKPALTLEPIGQNIKIFAKALQQELDAIAKDFKGIQVNISGKIVEIIVPDTEKLTHEDQFALVVRQFLQYRKSGSMPKWEKAFMLTKYYTLQKALQVSEIAKSL